MKRRSVTSNKPEGPVRGVRACSQLHRTLRRHANPAHRKGLRGQLEGCLPARAHAYYYYIFGVPVDCRGSMCLDLGLAGSCAQPHRFEAIVGASVRLKNRVHAESAASRDRAGGADWWRGGCAGPTATAWYKRCVQHGQSVRGLSWPIASRVPCSPEVTNVPCAQRAPHAQRAQRVPCAPRLRPLRLRALRGGLLGKPS